jgi:hypothetical protein
MCQTLNGNWISTREQGRCAEGERPGDGRCFWREVELKRNVNATCVRNTFLAALQKNDNSCHKACPQPSNMSSTCWTNCLLSAITGNKSKGVKPLTHKGLLKPFMRAFDSDDAAKGGCPEVHVPGHTASFAAA